MIKAYVNYPNPHITAHQELSCGDIQKMRKADQRYIIINMSTISGEIRKFSNKEYVFAAHPGANDMWLEIDFENLNFERALLDYIHILIGKYYSPFVDITIEKHRCFYRR